MPSEMRRPAPIDIHHFVDLLDDQLRNEVALIERRALPTVFHRFARLLRTALRPLLQSGAMALTSIAVIVAVGVAPATVSDPAPPESLLAIPGIDRSVVVDSGSTILDRLPPDEFLAVESFQTADNRDIPHMTME